MRTFDTGATRDDDDTKPDYAGYLSPFVIEAFGKYMTAHRIQSDGSLRASGNWKKGIAKEVYLSSLLRHVVEVWGIIQGGPGDLQESLCAVYFNAGGMLHEHLQDTSRQTQKK
jgi:hypothetical protein